MGGWVTKVMTTRILTLLGLCGDEGKQEGKSFGSLQLPPLSSSQPSSESLGLVLKTIVMWEPSVPTDPHNGLAGKDRQQAASGENRGLVLRSGGISARCDPGALLVWLSVSREGPPGEKFFRLDEWLPAVRRA